jgi:uncharacterized protein (DUF305 family)
MAFAHDPGTSHAAHEHQPEEVSRTQAASSDEQAFLVQNDSAMSIMMTEMTIRPTGDIDRDFVAMMVPHHQGAINMALAVLRYGRNEQIRRLAQEIIITQQQEITAMRHAIGDPLPLAPMLWTAPNPSERPDATPEAGTRHPATPGR